MVDVLYRQLDFKKIHVGRFTCLACCLFFVLFSTVPGTAEVTLNGTSHISLKTVAGKWGMQYQWLSKNKEVLLSSQWTRLQFKLHQRYCLLNGNRIFLGWPVSFHRGDLYISERDFESALNPILVPQTFSDVPKLYRIVIDPGHGGRDHGAENRRLGVNEKDNTLKLANMLKQKLSAHGYEVLLTRTKDEFVALTERSDFANQHKADLFISLHFNATSQTSVEGVETFVFTLPWHPSTSRSKLSASDKRSYPGNEHSAWSSLAGYYIHSSIVSGVAANDRGLKRARFTVLRDLNCPGLLIEGGFLSHQQEGSQIRTSAYQKRLADAIIEGILTYQKTLNRIRSASEHSSK